MGRDSKEDNISSASRLLLRINGKTALVILAVLIGIFVFMGLLAALLGFKAKNYRILDNEVTVDIYQADTKKTSHYESNIFKAPEKGDMVMITVPINDSNDYPNSYLCFNVYNAIVRVVFNTDDSLLKASMPMSELDHSESADGYKDEEYFQYDIKMENGGRMTGHQLLEIPIPKEAAGHTAQIFLLQQENHTTSRYDGISIAEGKYAFLYPLVMSSSFEFPIFISFFILGIIIFISFLVLQLIGQDMRPGIWLSLFCLCISTWVLGYNGEINLLSDNFFITCMSEYVTLYLVPVTLYGYLKYENFNRKIILYFKAVQWASLALFLVATVLEFTVRGLGYASVLVVLHLLLLFTTLATLYFVLFGVGPRKDISRRVLRIGFIIALCFLVIEVVRLYLNKMMLNMPDFVQALLKHSYGPYVLLALESSFVISYLLRFLKNEQNRNKRQQLEQLAFYDSLTGIPNRNSCEQHMKKLTLDNPDKYTMVFFDTNDLKLANDRYGHETGDKLLKAVAGAINDGFGDFDGFYGRIGGDEFMACVEDPKDADAGIKSFYNSIKQINKRKLLPFTVYVAIGRCDHTSDDGQTPQEILKAADNYMYENKVKIKGEKNVR